MQLQESKEQFDGVHLQSLDGRSLVALQGEEAVTTADFTLDTV